MSWGKARDIVWTVLGVAGLFYVAGSLLQLVAGGVLIFVLAALLAFVISPLVTRLQRRAGMARGPAALAIYTALIATAGTIGTLGVSAMGTQLAALATTLPVALQDVEARIPIVEAHARAYGVAVDLRAMLVDLIAGVQRPGLATQGIAWAGAAGVTALNALLLLVLSFYLAVDGRRLSETAIAMAPARTKPYLLFVEKTLLRIVGGYLRGQLIMGIIVGLGVLIMCLVLGLRYSVLLAALAFTAEFMPLVGPVLMAIVLMLVGFVDSGRLALIAPAIYLVLRLGTVYLLGPRVFRRTVGIHPIATILGLVVGAKLFGIWGIVFAAPVLGFVSVIAGAIYREVQAGLTSPTRPQREAPRPTLANQPAAAFDPPPTSTPYVSPPGTSPPGRDVPDSTPVVAP